MLDVLASVIALYLSFLIRFEFTFPFSFIHLFIEWSPLFALCQAIVFYFSGLYARIWRYTSLFDLYAILKSILLVCVISTFYVFIHNGSSGYPRSILLLYFILNNVLTVGLRLSVRVYYTHYHQSSLLKNQNPKKVLLLEVTLL